MGQSDHSQIVLIGRISSQKFSIDLERLGIFCARFFFLTGVDIRHGEPHVNKGQVSQRFSVGGICRRQGFESLQRFAIAAQELGQGVVVNQGDWQKQLDDNKNAFMLDFVQRTGFADAYPNSLTPAEFVNRLFANAGVIPSASELANAVGRFGGDTNSADSSARAKALRDVSENPAFISAEMNRAFVLMEYFGYLRRDPNGGQDIDYSGYDFWLRKLNQFNGNFIQAEMVKAFMSSIEYRQRFGP